jgi:membrane protease YdiL (CAAX protease family)
MRVDRARLRRRWVELLALFGLLPLLLSAGPRAQVLPVILGSGLICGWLLWRDPTFARAELWAAREARGFGRGVLARALALGAALAVVAGLRDPAALFALPRTRPLVWLVILVAYPVLSVYPQEVVFRTFFFHRYRDLLRTPVARVLASALAFAWGHVILHNGLVIALTTVGGLLFAATYERSRSLFLVTLEHALYGCWLLTIGFGGLFQTALRFAQR